MTTNRNLILILEDSLNRLALMREALEIRVNSTEIRHWDSVWAMRKELGQLLAQACLISLDFDLSNSTSRNPGDGMDAAQALNRLEPVCPVIVHTSLAEDSRRMAQALREHGWRVEQVIFNRREAVADWVALVEELAPGCGDDSGGEQLKLGPVDS